MKILYSPMGGSDPINNNLDGSWLHICRHIRPDKCIIFLTQLMCVRRADFEKTNQWLSEWLISHGLRTENIELIVESHEEIDNPQSHDQYYKMFEQALTQLHSQYPDAELYVNCSSGTPAIKESLEIISSYMEFPITICRVNNDPTAAMATHEVGIRETASVNDSIEKKWKCNKDNYEGTVCRLETQSTYEPNPREEVFSIIQVRRLLKEKDYRSALAVLNEKGIIGVLPNSNVLKVALEGAAARKRLDLETAIEKLSEAGYTDIRRFIPYPKSDLNRAAESILLMSLDAEQKRLDNVLRSLTPTLYSLTLAALTAKGVDIKNWLNYNGKLKYDKIPSDYRELIYPNSNGIPASYPSTDNLRDVVKKLYGEDSPVYKLINSLRGIEESGRNRVAHELFPVTDSWLKEQTSCSVAEILDMLRRLLHCLDTNNTYGQEYYASYDSISKYIHDILKLI